MSAPEPALSRLSSLEASAANDLSPSRVRVVVVHSDGATRQRLQEMLATRNWLVCAGVADCGPAAVRLIDAVRPEVAFVAVELPALLGTEVPQRASHRPLLVFLSSSSQRAVEAFELRALDYLLQPFSADRFDECLRRVRDALFHSTPSTVPRLGFFINSPAESLFVRQFGRILPIPLGSVQRFEADRDYVIAHVGRERHYLHLPLSRLEGRLDKQRFVRVHRSHIVNLEHVRRFRAHDSRRLAVELLSGDRVVASRERSRTIRRLAV